MKEVDKNKVICPYCGYRMPIFYDDTTLCKGLYVRCKGSHCKRDFEVVIKDGKQYKRSWVYEKLSGVFKNLF